MKKTLKILLIIILILICLVTAFYFYARYRLHHVSDKGNLQAALDKSVQSFMAEGRSYGLVVGIFKRGRVYYKGYGTTDRAGAVPPDSNTLFELASSGKLFTTTLLQLLHDQKVISLDDKIAPLLADKVTLPASCNQTTLRHLATHTAGFPSLPESFMAKMQNEANPYQDLVMQDLYDYLRHCKDKKTEGSFEYSNLGMGLLGHILELKTGKPYETLVKEMLLYPLGMQHTIINIPGQYQHLVAKGYNETGGFNPIWQDQVLTGAGSFLSNATDMIQFIKANLVKESLLYGTMQRTHQPQPGGETSLGWILPDGATRFMGNEGIRWHNGMAGGYASFIAIDPVNESGLILLSNKAEDVTMLGMRLMRLVNTQSWKP